MTKANLARQYRDKHGIKMATRKLARIMYNENKLLFKDEESARFMLRAIEGKAGNKGKKLTKITHPAPERPYNPYNLPESYQDERLPFRLPISCNNILLISDFIPCN